MGPEWVWWRFQQCFNKEGKLVFYLVCFSVQYSDGQKKSSVGT